MIDRFFFGKSHITIGPKALDIVCKDLAENKEINQLKVALFCGQESYKHNEKLKKFIKNLSSLAKINILHEIKSYPTFNTCEKETKQLLNSEVDILIALGGGSVVDTAKISNCAAGSGGSVQALIKGEQKALANYAKTFIVIPTTAGTGSEISPYATLWDFDSLKKYSLETNLSIPNQVYIDPSLTKSLPLNITTATAIDALSHAMESMWSKHSTPFTDCLASKAAQLIFKFLPLLSDNPQDDYLRSQLSWASLLAGMAISHTKTAAAHAISYILTLKYNIPHGIAVGIFLPHVMSMNLKCITGEKLNIFKECFKVKKKKDMINYLVCFLKKMNVQLSLNYYGIKDSDIDFIVSQSLLYNRLENNIFALTEKDIKHIIYVAL